jgi:N-acetylglucosamine-6-phosphate deacetylase
MTASPRCARNRAAGEVHEYPNHFVLPGFVDLQVNGAFGIEAATEPERLSELSRKLHSTGTTSILPTVISSHVRYTAKRSPPSPTL